MFLGDFPLLFLVEIAVRTFVLYAYSLLMLRLMGRRGMRQISTFDLAIIIALGSAVGDPMFYPDVPLLHGMVVITVIVVMERLLAELVQRSEAADVFISGKPIRVVHLGRLELRAGAETGLSRDELFGELRCQQVQQLGQVRVAYLEQGGEVSAFLFEDEEVRPGLPIVPPWELEPPTSYEKGDNATDGGPYACSRCAETVYLKDGQVFPVCPRCEGDEWVVALQEPLRQVR
jgi:uncharacterized membrane protein YcaP (DUF421 family)